MPTAPNRYARFEGRTVLVTGAAGGIGRAIADRLHSEGASLALLDRDVEAIPTREGSHAIRCDLADLGQVESAVAEAVKRFGRLDGVVNNAGMMNPEGFPPAGEPDDQFERILRINVTGMMRIARAAWPHLVASARTHDAGSAIVNVGSVMGQGTYPGFPGYTTSKAAVLGLTRALALDGGPDRVRVTACLPGAIETPMQHRARAVAQDAKAHKAATLNVIPLGRIGLPEDVAALISFLLSDDAAWITGSAHAVDGGVTARGP